MPITVTFCTSVAAGPLEQSAFTPTTIYLSGYLLGNLKNLSELSSLLVSPGGAFYI
jgi:hypothetical protein